MVAASAIEWVREVTTGSEMVREGGADVRIDSPRNRSFVRNTAQAGAAPGVGADHQTDTQRHGRTPTRLDKVHDRTGANAPPRELPPVVRERMLLGLLNDVHADARSSITPRKCASRSPTMWSR